MTFRDPASIAGATLPVEERTAVLVIGAGRAGLAAAIAAAEAGRAVIVVDENPVPAETMGDDVPQFFGGRMTGAARNRAAMMEAFHAAHEQIYGHADRNAPLQLIAIRLVIAGQTDKPDLPRHALQPGPASMLREAEVWMDGRFRQVGLYRRTDLRSGQSFSGPAVVTQDDCTTVVPPGYAAVVDEYTNIRITEATP